MVEHLGALARLTGVNVLEKVPGNGAISPVWDKRSCEELLQIMEPVATGVLRSTRRGQCIGGKGGRIGKRNGRLLENVRESGHLGGNVVGHESLHFNAFLTILNFQRLRKPLDENLTNKEESNC